MLVQRIFSFPILLGCLLVLGVFYKARAFDVDPDLWWHLRVGEQILATHHWPTSDPYSFTTNGQPWLASEWLGDILFSATFRFGGIRALDMLLFVLGSAIALGLYFLGILRTKNSKAAFVAASVLLILATASMSLRPQMLGYSFLILTLIILERFRQGKSQGLWFLPVLFLVWVNTHGSWVIGLGTIFAYWVGGLFQFHIGGFDARLWSPSDRRHLSFVFLLSLCALFLTPYGSQLSARPFEFVFSLPLNLASIREWQSMPFNLPGGKLFLGLLLGFLAAQVAFRFTWRLEELGLFLFGTMMACLHVRFLLVFVPFFAPLLAIILARWVPPYERVKDRHVLNFVLMAIIITGMIHYFPSGSELREAVAQKFPLQAVTYLKGHVVSGPMYNSYAFGGYLIWSLGLEHKVFIDGRADLYERGGLLAAYLYISRAKPGALSVLRNYGVQSCLVENNEALVTLLDASPDWQRVYADGVSALFIHRASADAQTFARIQADSQ